MTFVYGFASDRTQLRGPIILIGLTLALVFWIGFQQTSTSSDRWLKYAMQVLTQGFVSSYHVRPVSSSHREPPLTHSLSMRHGSHSTAARLKNGRSPWP